MISAPASPRGGAHYGFELAKIHHDHFGMVARAAARELLSRLSRSGIGSGRVCDLAAGSGILSRAVVEAGFELLGVELSDEMLRIARSEAPTADFRHQSLWDAELPACVAIAAVGEAFSYAADPQASLPALEARLATIHRALVPVGLLLFDVASPGRSGPTGIRRTFWSGDGAYLGLEEREDSSAQQLTRLITIFLPDGDRYRKVEETHVLRLYPPEQVESLLTAIGFEWERLRRYDDFELLAGWDAYAATKRVSE